MDTLSALSVLTQSACKFSVIIILLFLLLSSSGSSSSGGNNSSSSSCCYCSSSSSSFAIPVTRGTLCACLPACYYCTRNTLCLSTRRLLLYQELCACLPACYHCTRNSQCLSTRLFPLYQEFSVPVYPPAPGTLVPVYPPATTAPGTPSACLTPRVITVH